MNPFSYWYSADWNPSGIFTFRAPSIRRLPAKPMLAPGSARMMSPRLAKLAYTPPVVASVNTEINGTPDSFICRTASAVFAICMSARIPSCMRAPPDAAKHTKHARSRTASETVRQNRSPTADPMLAMMNFGSIAPNSARLPSMVP